MQKKRTKHWKAILFCLTLLSVVLSACQSDLYEIEEVETVDVVNFGITDARNWLETNAHLIRPNKVITRSADGSETTVTQPPVFNWNLAQWSSNPNWEVVELPWEYEEREQVFALWEVWQHAQTNNTIPENVTRLVIMQCRETGATYGFRMRMAPDLNFLLSYGGNLSDNKLLDRSSRLSGIVLFYTLDGQFVNGWRYHDGEITAEIVAKNEVNVEDLSTPTTRSWWNNDPNHSFDLCEVVITGCRPPGLPMLSLDPFCLHTIPPSGGGNNGMPGSGGGNGGDSGPAGNQSIGNAPNARKLFDLNDSDAVALENMLREILRDCMGEELFDRLIGLLYGRTLSFQFQAGRDSHYNPNTRMITIGREASSPSGALLHELFHVYQGLRHGTHNWTANSMNREIEAWFAEYVFAVRGNFEEMMLFYRADDPFRRSIAGLYDFVTLDGRIRLGANTETILWTQGSVYRQFRAHPSPAMNTLTLNRAQTPLHMFENIRQLSINC